MYKTKNITYDVSKHSFLTIFFCAQYDGSKSVIHTKEGWGLCVLKIKSLTLSHQAFIPL
jgi:hypothetical protein